jgi:hypothetical protein
VTALLTLIPCGLFAIPCGLFAPRVLDFGLIVEAALAYVVAHLFLRRYAMLRLVLVSVTAALATMPAITTAIELACGRAVIRVVLCCAKLILPSNLTLLVIQRRKWLSPRLSALRATIFNSQHRTQPAAPRQ